MQEDMFHEDYAPVPKSERHRIADDLAGWLSRMKLSAPGEGEEVIRHEGGKYYKANFGRDGENYGTVYVYGPDYIRLWYRSSLAGLGPADDTRLFGSAEDVIAFISLAFVEGNAADAMEIPLREPKRKKKGVGNADQPEAG
jgi:hypothetical protein